ncbi:predicted protein [Nematostella vectensis]|uniref:Uncharacterized protein n=1 Tax=Nematostella vectensis TaxID=45351 RepID=A7S4P2_NEMVE|nr:predicted protein [Nematostella vectensis]|eukprot:XP_001633383.1 predicted protein [Nematostella vectensis]
MSDTEKTKAKMSEDRKKSTEKKIREEESESNRDSFASMEAELVLEEQISGAEVERTETESQPMGISKEKPKRRKFSGIFKKVEGKKEKTEENSKRNSSVSQDGAVVFSGEELSDEQITEETEHIEENLKTAEKTQKRRSFRMFKKKDKEIKEIDNCVTEKKNKEMARNDQQETTVETGMRGDNVKKEEIAEDIIAKFSEGNQVEEKVKKRRSFGIFKDKDKEKDKEKAGSVISLETADFEKEEAADEILVEKTEVKEKKQQKRKFSFSNKKKNKEKEMDVSESEEKGEEMAPGMFNEEGIKDEDFEEDEVKKHSRTEYSEKNQRKGMFSFSKKKKSKVNEIDDSGSEGKGEELDSEGKGEELVHENPGQQETVETVGEEIKEVDFEKEEIAENSSADVTEKKQRKFRFSKKKIQKVQELDNSVAEAKDKEKPVNGFKEKETGCQVGSQSEEEDPVVAKSEDEVKEEATEEKRTESEEAPKRKKSLKRRLSFSRKNKAKKTEEKQDEEGEAREGTMDDNEVSQKPELVNQSEAESREAGGTCAEGDEKTANELALADSDTNDTSDTEQTESEEESGYFRLGIIYSIFEAIFRQKDKMPEMSVTKSRELVIYTVNQGYIRITDASGSIFTQASQAPRRAVMYLLQLLVKKYPHAFKNLKKRKSKKSKGTSDVAKNPVAETDIF